MTMVEPAGVKLSLAGSTMVSDQRQYVRRYQLPSGDMIRNDAPTTSGAG